MKYHFATRREEAVFNDAVENILKGVIDDLKEGYRAHPIACITVIVSFLLQQLRNLDRDAAWKLAAAVVSASNAEELRSGIEGPVMHLVEVFDAMVEKDSEVTQ